MIEAETVSNRDFKDYFFLLNHEKNIINLNLLLQFCRSITERKMSLNDYKLSAELLGHSLDVRAIATADKYIVSGSRDKTAKVWEYNG